MLAGGYPSGGQGRPFHTSALYAACTVMGEDSEAGVRSWLAGGERRQDEQIKGNVIDPWLSSTDSAPIPSLFPAPGKLPWATTANVR